MRKFGGLLAAVVVTAGTAGCGETEERPRPVRPNSSKVALTLNWPGTAPWALITYERTDGRRCHALGTLTDGGPRLLSAPGLPLASALESDGRRCVDALDGDVTFDVVRAPNGAGRLIGGIARRGVTRVVVGGERVRPSRTGAFLIMQRDGESAARARRLRVVRSDGSGHSVPLPRVAAL